MAAVKLDVKNAARLIRARVSKCCWVAKSIGPHLQGLREYPQPKQCKSNHQKQHGQLAQVGMLFIGEQFESHAVRCHG
jgi:hypothetical protein